MSSEQRNTRGLMVLLAMLAGVCVLVLVSGCSTGSAGEGQWVHTESVEGGVRTVRTESGSIWGTNARLIEQMSIGGADGPPEQLFGRVSSIWSHGDRIFVLDGQAPALRVFSMAGDYLTTIGGQGSGPGEYQRPRSVVVDPGDGAIYIRDGSQGRMNVYDADGTSRDTWPMNAGISTSRQMVLSDDGGVYTPVWANMSGSFDEWRTGMARMMPDGASADTLMAPRMGFEEWTLEAHSEDNDSISITTVPFSPQEMWVMTPSRAMIGAVSETYRFVIFHPDGTRTAVEKRWDPVQVQPEESRWYRAMTTADMRGTERGWAWRGRGIPDAKPPFESFFADRDGRIWVRRYGPGERLEGCIEEPEDQSGFYTNPCWRDSFWYDVFDVSGRFLGQVDIPDGFQDSPPPHISGDMVIGHVQDDDGIPYVRLYRLIVPDRG